MKQTVSAKLQQAKASVRKIQIINNDHPEWGTWGISEDNGKWFEIRSMRGDRVLFYSEFEKSWSFVQ